MHLPDCAQAQWWTKAIGSNEESWRQNKCGVTQADIIPTGRVNADLTDKVYGNRMT